MPKLQVTRMVAAVSILPAILGGDCGNNSGLPTELGISVMVTVTGAGAGSGRVQNPGEGVPEINCRIANGVATESCSDRFTDIGGGGTILLQAMPDDGSTFDGWVGCSQEDGAVCTLSFPPTQDVAFFVTAEFRPATCTGASRFEFPMGGGVDGDFAVGWASEKFFDTTPGMTATSTSMPSAMEGNPAPSRSTKHTYDPGGGIIIAHVNSATFDPAGQAANFVTFQFDARKIPWIAGNAADMVFRALIKQDDRFFQGPSFEVQAFDFAWLPLTTGACLTQNSFLEQDTMANPDFGRPMQFGYATANSGAGAPVVDREGLLDNFRVEVR